MFIRYSKKKKQKTKTLHGRLLMIYLHKLASAIIILKDIQMKKLKNQPAVTAAATVIK